MENNIMVVLTNAVDGRDDEFNEWYTKRHLIDVVGLDGFQAAQRFVLTDTDPLQDDVAYRYLAIYEIPDGQIDKARAALDAARGTDALPKSSAMHPERFRGWYTAMTERVISKDAT
jgi:hypothetical protein